jgi:alpha-L-fucosidase 2
MIKKILFQLLPAGLLFFSVLNADAQANKSDLNTLLAANNVSWNTPGPSSQQSMPLGNGDIGLNAWVEPNGDLCFYISKTDAWGAAASTEKNNWIKEGGVLMKLGEVRVSLSPNPMKVSGSPFLQSLKLHNGEIVINEGDSDNKIQIRLWVDANNPVIRVETKSNKAITAKVTLNNWRPNGGGDSILTGKTQQILWYHRNTGNNVDRHLANITFGAVVKGKGFAASNDTTLQSVAANSQLISIYPLTSQSSSARQWQQQLEQQISGIDKINLEQSRVAHQQWWDAFWHRSWIYINGDAQAKSTTQGYVLQRFLTACAGRGKYPVKFNGSIFVVDNPALKDDGKTVYANADYRGWGGQYWFQNTRPMYWPRLMAGDFDEMLPLFNMYARILPDNKKQVQDYYHHGGAYFAETSPFWGGLLYMGPEVKENWTGHYFTPILELSMMMLDYYEYTGDKTFGKNTLLPVAAAGLEFFDKHFGRDGQGKLLLDPDNSIEMFWKVHNPAPDIAGLHAVAARMLKLPNDITNKDLRAQWQKLLSELPDLPKGEKEGQQVLLPYTGEQTAKPRNLENPELYAIYPFRLYGLGKPDLQTALNTFNERKFKDKGCWEQDPIQAAMLGLSDVAKTYVSFNFARKDPRLKFPAFWDEGHDYMPDQDNGGNGENGLQNMLLQTDGKKILLLPAWPKEWNAQFKLNAPYQTTVQGRVQGGKLVDLVVTPASRKKDVIDMSL